MPRLCIVVFGLLGGLIVIIEGAFPTRVLAQDGGRDCPQGTGASVRCFGHVLVTAGSERLPVFVDGVEVGLTPLFLTRAHTDRPRVEVRRVIQALSVARVVRLRRGRVTLVDVRVGAARRRSLADATAPLTWARYFTFDECDGYFSAATPTLEVIDPASLGYLREHAHPSDARRWLPAPARLQAMYVGLCDGGDGDACAVAGRAHSWSPTEGVPEDFVRSVALLRRGCDVRNAESCGLLGRMHQYGRGVAVDPREADWLLGLACRLGDRSSCP